MEGTAPAAPAAAASTVIVSRLDVVRGLPSLARQRRDIVILAVAYVAIASASQVFLAKPIDTALAHIGLGGLGVFVWTFGALILGLEVGRNIVVDAMRECESVLRDTRAPDHAATPLRLRIHRLRSWVSMWTDLGKELASQLGLAGTVVGLGGAVASMTSRMKDVAGGGGSALAALGGAHLQTAFSATILGCVVIVGVILLAARLRARLDALAGEVDVLFPSDSRNVVDAGGAA